MKFTYRSTEWIGTFHCPESSLTLQVITARIVISDASTSSFKQCLTYLFRLAVTVPGLVRAAIVELDIDTEIASLPEAARANHEKSVDAFISLTSDFVSQNPVGSLDDFLTWLAVMDAEQSLSIPEEPAAEGAIPS